MDGIDGLVYLLNQTGRALAQANERIIQLETEIRNTQNNE